jgi:uncharacterized protein (TIGR03083 family)
MAWLSDDRYREALRGFSAGLAGLVADDLERPVPTCPGWTFKQLATHVGRGDRWAGQIVATRACAPIPLREVPDGKLPETADGRAAWLAGGAERVIEAVAAAGDEPVWAFLGTRPARFWLRRRTHEAAVHLADAQLAAGQQASLPADVAADGIDEWLTEFCAAGGAVAELGMEPAGLRGDGQTLHVHVTDPGVTGEWLAELGPEKVTVTAGHARADVAVRGPAASLLLVLTRRLPPSAVEAFGDQALLAQWLEHTRF